MYFCHNKIARAALLSLSLTCGGTVLAAGELSCKLGLLQDLGWKVARTDTPPDIHHGDACEMASTPLFTFNTDVETNDQILDRTSSAIYSVTSRCLVNRRYRDGIKKAVVSLTDNKEFEFISGGSDPRDPFIPPDNSWVAANNRGYDLPASSVSESIDSLYTKPFIAECAAAT
ncbi:MAG: hypothetical protein AAF404_04905, partial [Pseudomonadota bacterium]